MHASVFLDSMTKFDPARPGLPRAIAVVPSAALAVVLLLGVLPASAGAISPAPTPVMPSAASPLRHAAPAASSAKVVAHAGAAKRMPTRLVYRKHAATRATVRRAPRAVASRSARRSGWLTARVSWYGPGFYGRTMAGGGTLRRDSMVVAHRSLPFGTRVMFSYKGHSVTAVVRDRGPYAGGRTFDLGPGTARALGFGGVGTVRYRVLGR